MDGHGCTAAVTFLYTFCDTARDATVYVSRARVTRCYFNTTIRAGQDETSKMTIMILVPFLFLASRQRRPNWGSKRHRERAHMHFLLSHAACMRHTCWCFASCRRQNAENNKSETQCEKENLLHLCNPSKRPKRAKRWQK